MRTTKEAGESVVRTVEVKVTSSVLIANKRRFRVGDWAKVLRVVKTKIVWEAGGKEYAGKKVLCASKDSCPKVGQVVGLTARWLGWRGVGEDGSYSVFESPDAIQKVELWQVKFGVINKPVLVLDEDIAPADDGEDLCLPLLYTAQPPWDEKARRLLSEESKKWPRDRGGRWVAG